MRTNRIISIGVAALVLLLALGACNHPPAYVEAQSVERVNENTVRISIEAMPNLHIETARIQELPERLDLMGRVSVTEDRTTVIPARVAGRIDAIALASGEWVQAGQTLATLFSPDFISAREEYLQALKQTRIVAGLDRTPTDLENLTELAGKKLRNMGLTADDVQSLSTPGATAAGLIVRSPRAGVIIEKKAVLGSLVNVGDSLFTVADISKVWFSGDLYSEDLPRVHKSQEVVIDEIPGSAPITGRISFISPIVDPTAHTIKLRALMNNAQGHLRADMYVHGGIILSKKRALLIPSTAIIRNGVTDFVYRQIAERTFQRVEVKATEELKDLTAIGMGIRDGDSVITDGSLFLESALTSSGK